jgi:hypothetical protein
VTGSAKQVALDHMMSFLSDLRFVLFPDAPRRVRKNERY